MSWELIRTIVPFVLGVLAAAYYAGWLILNYDKLLDKLAKTVIGQRTAQASRAISRGIRRLSLSAHNYLTFRHDIAPVLVFSVFVNWACHAIAVVHPSVVYLDMVGTATGAFLLGPWWGACVGYATNTLTNAYTFTQADVLVVPWSLVNVVGGLYWGWAFRKLPAFVNFDTTTWATTTGTREVRSFRRMATFLLVLGVGCAFASAIPGAYLTVYLGQGHALALDPDLATTIDQFVASIAARAPSFIVPLLSITETTLRYVPDKVLCALLALVFMRYALPRQHFVTSLAHQSGLTSHGNSVPCLVMFVVACGELLTDHSGSIDWHSSSSPGNGALRYVGVALWGIIAVLAAISGVRAVCQSTSDTCAAFRTWRSLVDSACSGGLSKRLPKTSFVQEALVACVILLILVSGGLVVTGWHESISIPPSVGRFGSIIGYVLVVLALLRVAARQWATMSVVTAWGQLWVSGAWQEQAEQSTTPDS